MELKVKKTRPCSLRTNGKVERFIKALLEEWAYVMPCSTSAACSAAGLNSLLDKHNQDCDQLESQPDWRNAMPSTSKGAAFRPQWLGGCQPTASPAIPPHQGFANQAQDELVITVIQSN